MLILTLKVGQAILIDDDVKLTIIGAERRNIRFTIQAPRHIAVHREEVYRRIQNESASRDP